MKRPPRANPYRDRWTGDLRADDVGATVRVAGWVHRRRDHGGLIFLDLRDRSGLASARLSPRDRRGGVRGGRGAAPRARDQRHGRGRGSRGGQRQPEPRYRRDRGSGARAAQRSPRPQTPPFPVDEDRPLDEMTAPAPPGHRPAPRRRCAARWSCATRWSRRSASHLGEHDFLEIETPILTRSTPEGARDFLVPNRRDPGHLVRVAPVAPALQAAADDRRLRALLSDRALLRDEDMRADRQAEFTQLDVEMAFVEEDDVVELIEGLMAEVFAVGGFDVPPPPWGAHDLRRGAGPLWLRPPRPPLRARAARRVRRGARRAVQGLPVGAGLRRRCRAPQRRAGRAVA